MTLGLLTVHGRLDLLKWLDLKVDFFCIWNFNQRILQRGAINDFTSSKLVFVKPFFATDVIEIVQLNIQPTPQVSFKNSLSYGQVQLDGQSSSK